MLAGLAAFCWLNQGLGALGTSQKHTMLLDLPTAHGWVRLERWEQSNWGNSYRGLVLLWQGRVVDVYGHVLATGAARALARADGSVLGPSAYPAYLAPDELAVEPLLTAIAADRPWLVWASPRSFTASERPALLASLREAAPAIRALFPAGKPADPRLPAATDALEISVGLFFDHSPALLTLTDLAYADPADYPALVYRRTAAHRGPAGWFENLTIEPDGTTGLDARARPDEGGFGGNLGQFEAGTNRLLIDPTAWPFADEHPAPTLAELTDFEDAHGQRLGQRFTLVKADSR